MRAGFFQYDVGRCAEDNVRRLQRALERWDGELLVLPELSLGGYLFADRRQLLAQAEEVPSGAGTRRMMALSRDHNCTIVFGLAEREGEACYNTAVVVSRGSYVGKYRKIHLSDFEKRLFCRGSGSGVFTVDGLTIGVQICFDLWFPELSREQLKLGARLFCALANFGGETTCRICPVRAIENVTPLILCNRVGRESIPGMEAEFLGRSAVVDASGRPLCAAPAGEEYVGCCDVPLPRARANVICSDFDGEIALHAPPRAPQR